MRRKRLYCSQTDMAHVLDRIQLDLFRNLVKSEVAKLSAKNDLPAQNYLEANARAQCDSCEALY